MQAKTKILFVRPHMAKGGADQVTLMLLRHLDRDKYEPSLALMRAEGPLMEDVPDDVKVYDCKARSLWFMVGPLRKVLSDNQFDIVYSTCGGASMPLCMAYWFLPASKMPQSLVVSERNILLPLYKGKTKRYFMLYMKKLLYRKAHFVTAVSKGVGEEIRDYLKVPDDKIKVVNNPVIDDKLYEMASGQADHPWFNSDDFVFLAVGRLVEQKDYPTMIGAFELVKEKYKSVKLIVLGDGARKDALNQLVKDKGLEGSIEFLGYQKNPFAYMRKADAFVLSSKHEGMPGVLVQALAINKHCISTDCPTGPNEIIEHNKNGLLVPVGDVSKLAEAMEVLASDSSVYKTIEGHADEKLGKFEVDQAIASYLHFIS